MTVWKNILDKMFSMDKLEALAQKNPMCAIAYFQLLTGLNAVILTPEPNMMKHTWDIFDVFTEVIPDTLDGKLKAIAVVFSHVSKNMDALFTTTVLGNLLSKTDLMDLLKQTLSIVVTGKPIPRVVRVTKK